MTKFILCTATFLVNGILLYGQKSPDLIKYVNPLVGTDSKFELSNGNTYPAIAMPWGLNFWTPQTNIMGDGWCYQYTSNKIRGFKQTHQPSPWINDYGAFSIFATTEKLVFDEHKRESWYSHKAETVSPNYYKAYLADYNTTVEITATERAAVFRITYPQTDKAYLIVDAFYQNSYVKVLPKQKKIVGCASNANGGVPDNFKYYFVIYFDKEVENVFTVEDSMITDNGLESESTHSGTIIQFRTKRNEQVNLKVASSFIGMEQAELNLKREIGNGTFDDIAAQSNNKENVYVSEAKLNDQVYTKTYLRHKDIMNGGTLELQMSAKPNKLRGIDDDDYPYSMTNELRSLDNGK